MGYKRSLFKISHYCSDVMASFSLEQDGLFSFGDTSGLSDDPFVNAGIPCSQNRVSGGLILDSKYSDISDDD